MYDVRGKTKSGEVVGHRDFLFLSTLGAAILTGIVVAFSSAFSGPIVAVIPWFVPLVNTFLLLSVLSVAYLALSRFHILRDPASYWVGVASVVLGIGLVFYVLSWPGLLPGGREIIGHLPSTSAWMAIIAQTLLAAFLLTAAVVSFPGKRTEGARWPWSIIAWGSFATALHLLVLIFEDNLPTLVGSNGTFTLTFLIFHWVAVGLFTVGIFFSTRRYLSSGDALLAYVALAQIMCAGAILLLVLGANRYDLWWYVARILTMSSFVIIMFGLLTEYVGLFRREQEKGRVLDETLKKLRDSRDRLILAQKAGRVDIFDLDVRTGKMVWTEQQGTTSGPSAGYSEGNYEDWVKRLPTENRSQLENQVRDWMSRKRGHVEYQHRVTSPDSGEDRWLAISAHLNYLSDGTPARLIGTMVDVTERKRMEEWLRRSKEELEIRVQERTAELNEINKELQRSNQSLQDFASIASHDLQEPLRKVQVFGARLNEKYADLLGERGNDYLHRMLSAAGRMQSLLESLLTYSRVTSRKQPFENLNLKDVVREVLSDLEVTIEQTRGKVEVGDLPTVYADPNQMHQLFQNLIGNALKFHKEDKEPIVRIHSYGGNNHHEVLVEDNGIGFDEQYLDKILAPFQRLHGRSGRYEGTGMGLAICKKIVERHGGKITARSMPGKGSTFIIDLPVKQDRLSP